MSKLFTPQSLRQSLDLAEALLGQDKFSEADRILRQLLLTHPASAETFNLLSMTVNLTGRALEAVELSEKAIELAPRRAEFHFSYGRALKACQRLDDAVRAYEQSLRLRPRYPEALVSLGIALKLTGRLDEAISKYERALRIKPDFPEALGNLGNALAERIVQRAGGLASREELQTAEQVQRRALALAPNDPGILHNLGITLKQSGRSQEATAMFNRALSIDSSRVDTVIQFAAALKRDLRPDLAKQLLEKWLEQHGNNPDVMLTFAGVLYDLGEIDQATGWLNRESALRAETPESRHLRGRIMGLNPGLEDETLTAIEVFRGAIDSRPEYFEAVCSYLMSICYVEEDPAVLVAEHRARIAPIEKINSSEFSIPTFVNPNPERLKIGYVSSDFKRHSVAYFLEGILEAHDRSRFEIYSYNSNVGDDEVTDRLRALSDHWIECGQMSDSQVAERIREDRIDAAIDLSGLTSGSRLGSFQRRVAPCQVTYLGYPTTTGSDCFDYRITDAVIDPPGSEPYSTEPLLRFAVTMFCYRPGVAPSVGPPPAGLNGFVTFGSFNNLSKVTKRTLALWSRVLKAVPGSRLRLKSAALTQHGSREWIRRQMAHHGIESDRIVAQPFVADVRDHLNAYNDIDISLDTYPFNGATTTCEALLMGVPLVTLMGQTHPSRMGASILGAVDLSDLVARNESEYVEIARALASDWPRLRTIRAGMRARLETSRLLDKSGFTRDLEGLLAQACSNAKGLSGAPST